MNAVPAFEDYLFCLPMRIRTRLGPDRLFMPRDDAELKVYWAIPCGAYDSIINSPAKSLAVPRASATELPEISRTSLC